MSEREILKKVLMKGLGIGVDQSTPGSSIMGQESTSQSCTQPNASAGSSKYLTRVQQEIGVPKRTLGDPTNTQIPDYADRQKEAPDVLEHSVPIESETTIQVPTINQPDEHLQKTDKQGESAMRFDQRDQPNILPNKDCEPAAKRPDDDKTCIKLSVNITKFQILSSGIDQVTQDMMDKLPISKYRDLKDDESVDSDGTDIYWPKYHPKPPMEYEKRIVIPSIPKIKLPKQKLIYCHPSKSKAGFQFAVHGVRKR